jgi:hypothetical protein
VSWAGAGRRVRFVSWLSGNVAVVKGMAAMPPAVIGKLGQAHALARHIGDFLTDLANAGASGHTLRAYRGDLAQFAATTTGAFRLLSALSCANGRAPARPTAPRRPS